MLHYKPKQPRSLPPDYYRFRRNIILLGLSVSLFFTIVNLLFFWGFTSSLYDFGTFNQALWEVSKFQWPPTSSINWPYTPDNPFFSVHFAPIIFILTPLYWIKAMPEWLIIVHALCLGMTLWPLYETCFRLGASAKAAFFWAALFILQPNIIFTSMWDFHEQSLAIPLMALGMLAVVEKRLGMLLTCLLALVLTKEHYGVAVFGFGLLWGWAHRDWKTGIILMLSGFAIFYLILFQVIPVITGAEHPMFNEMRYGEGNYHLDRYSWMKWGGKDAVGYALYLLTDFVTIVWYLFLLAPLLFLPLFGFMFLAPAGADIAANGLSNWDLPRGFIAYHSAPIIPALMVASCFAAERLGHYFRWLSPENMLKGAYIVTIFTTGIVMLSMAPSIFPNAQHITQFGKTFPFPKALRDIQARLPENVAVSAAPTIGTYFSMRKEIYPFPGRLDRTDAIVLYIGQPLLARNIVNISSKKYPIGRLNELYPVSVREVLHSPDWGVTYWHHPWLLLEKNKEDVIDPKQVEKEILECDSSC